MAAGLKGPGWVIHPGAHRYPGLFIVWIPLVVPKDDFSGVLLKDIEFRPGGSLCPVARSRILARWSGRAKNDAAGRAERASTFVVDRRISWRNWVRPHAEEAVQVKGKRRQPPASSGSWMRVS